MLFPLLVERSNQLRGKVTLDNINRYSVLAAQQFHADIARRLMIVRKAAKDQDYDMCVRIRITICV